MWFQRWLLNPPMVSVKLEEHSRSDKVQSSGNLFQFSICDFDFIMIFFRNK